MQVGSIGCTMDSPAALIIENRTCEHLSVLSGVRALVESRIRDRDRDGNHTQKLVCDIVSDKNRAKRIYVSGRVQGVGYRYFVCRAAEQMGLAGYVRNLADGRVEVYVVGPTAKLRALLDQLRRGPQDAAVKDLAEADTDVIPEFARGFSIKHND